jgi:hypothetical protein
MANAAPQAGQATICPANQSCAMNARPQLHVTGNGMSSPPKKL